MITDEVVLVDGLIRTLDLVVTINVDKKFEGVEGTFLKPPMLGSLVLII